MDASYHKIQLNTEMHKAQQFRNSASEISNSQQTSFILRWQLIYQASIVTILEQNCFPLWEKTLRKWFIPELAATMFNYRQIPDPDTSKPLIDIPSVSKIVGIHYISMDGATVNPTGHSVIIRNDIDTKYGLLWRISTF